MNFGNWAFFSIEFCRIFEIFVSMRFTFSRGKFELWVSVIGDKVRLSSYDATSSSLSGRIGKHDCWVKKSRRYSEGTRMAWWGDETGAFVSRFSHSFLDALWPKLLEKMIKSKRARKKRRSSLTFSSFLIFRCLSFLVHQLEQFRHEWMKWNF